MEIIYSARARTYTHIRIYKFDLIRNYITFHTDMEHIQLLIYRYLSRSLHAHSNKIQFNSFAVYVSILIDKFSPAFSLYSQQFGRETLPYILFHQIFFLILPAFAFIHHLRLLKLPVARYLHIREISGPSIFEFKIIFSEQITMQYACWHSLSLIPYYETNHSHLCNSLSYEFQ